MVRALEGAVDDSSLDVPDRILAGSTLFALFARASVGDVSRIKLEPTLDLNGATDVGYVEAVML